jgi:hypothetical protein
MFCLIWVLVLTSTLPFVARSEVKAKELCFLVPSEDLLVVIANQPDCPIEFVTAYCVGFTDGGTRNVYQVRNRAKKSIKRYSIAIVSSEGTDSSSSIAIDGSDYQFLPGDTRPSLDDLNLDIIPLTDQLRGKYRINGKMKAIRIFIVVRAELADGSIYDATSKYKSLTTFFKKNPISVDEDDAQKK